LKKFTHDLNKPVRDADKKTKGQVHRIMKMVEARQKNQPFDECLNNSLEGFKDLKYVKSVCLKFFGEDVSLLF
jgi:hypothetical protein